MTTQKSIQDALGPEMNALLNNKFDSPVVETRRLLKEANRLVDLIRKYTVASAKAAKKDPELVGSLIPVAARAQVKMAIMALEDTLKLWTEQEDMPTLPIDPSQPTFWQKTYDATTKETVTKKGKKS